MLKSLLFGFLGGIANSVAAHEMHWPVWAVFAGWWIGMTLTTIEHALPKQADPVQDR